MEGRVLDFGIALGGLFGKFGVEVIFSGGVIYP